MNYIAEIKAFHDLVQVKQLSTGQIALWYALMYINNKCAWIEWFTVPNLTLELNTGLSRSGIAKARNVLKQYKIIDFKSNGTKATSYKLVSMSKSTQDSKQDKSTTLNSTQVSAQGSAQDSTQGSAQDGGTLNKLNETKLNETSTTMSFSEDEFQKIAKLYSENIEMPNQLTSNWLVDMLNDYGFTWLKNAIIIASQNGKRKQSYIKGILDNWKTNGGMRLTRDRSSKATKIQQDSAQYDMDVLEKQLLKNSFKG